MSEKSVHFFTLGCRLNQSETSVLENLFKQNGYSVNSSLESADVVIVNTCTVTERGDADTRKLVNRICKHNPNARIALIGCQAQLQQDILSQLPNVKWVIGNTSKFDLVSIIENDPKNEDVQIIVSALPKESFTIPISGGDESHTRANIKIQDGCDCFCSYCEIPYARGRARSREFDDIIKEAKNLAQAGHQELIITGINLGTYKNNNHNLLDVINHIEQIEQIKRIRISSIEPTDIIKPIIEKMSSRTKLCRYLHIPAQTCDDDILKDMKRKYTFEEFAANIQLAHNTIPNICIGTDIIVGFPTETDQHFENTKKRLEDLPINYIHTFSYSKRTKAQSRLLEQKNSDKSITQRSQIIRNLSVLKRNTFYQSLLGTQQEVLFEQKKKGTWTGLTDNYVRVHLNDSSDLSNQFLTVNIICQENDILIAEKTT